MEEISSAAWIEQTELHNPEPCSDYVSQKHYILVRGERNSGIRFEIEISETEPCHTELFLEFQKSEFQIIRNQCIQWTAITE